METVFTKIIKKEIKADIVYEDNDIIAFKDIYPAAPIHILFVPKKEIQNLAYATDEDILLLGKIQLTIAKVARDLGMDKDGYRVISNIGDFGGQTVQQMHYHLSVSYTHLTLPTNREV